MEIFPADNLNSITNLAGPIGRPPHFLSGSLQTVQDDIVENFNFTRYKNTAHFNFDGGLRDFHVTSKNTPFDKIIAMKPKHSDNFLVVSTTQMKNLY